MICRRCDLPPPAGSWARLLPDPAGRRAWGVFVGLCCVTDADVAVPVAATAAEVHRERYVNQLSGLTVRQAEVLAHVAAGTAAGHRGKLSVWDEVKGRRVEVGETVSKLSDRGFVGWHQVGVLSNGRPQWMCHVTEKGREALAVHPAKAGG